MCQCLRVFLFIILLDYYLYIDVVVGVCKLSDFDFFPSKVLFLTLKIGTESSKSFNSYGNSLLQSFFFFFLFNFYVIWLTTMESSVIPCPFYVEKFQVNHRMSL